MASVGSPSSDTELAKTPRLVKFLLGTVAQVHMTALKECFLSLTELQEPTRHTDATGSVVVAIAKGDAMIPVFFDDTITWLKLKDVYYTPDSDPMYSLISVTRLYAAGISVEWKSDIDHCSLLDSYLNIVARGYSRDCRWHLDVDLELIRYNNPEIQNHYSTGSTPEIPNMAYSKSKSTQSLYSSGGLEKTPHPSTSGEFTIEDNPCVPFSVDGNLPGGSNSDYLRFDDSSGASPLSLVYSGLYGPLPVSVGGNQYAASFIDNYSRFARIYFLKAPSGYLTAVKSFVQRMESDPELNRDIQMFCSGREEGEYISAYLSSRGVTLQTTSQKDSVARQFNHTIFTRVQSMLLETNLEHGWWEDAAAMAIYTFNRSPNALLNFNLPLDIWTQQSQKGPGTAPTSFIYRPFGSICIATPVETRGGKTRKGGTGGKMTKKELECRALRFDTGAGAWVVLTMAGDKMFSSKDVTFIDDEYE